MTWARLSTAALLFHSYSLLATPLIALREANNCGGCHKPGRSQRPVLERRCTLDCQGCHISPDGAGPRNQWGQYYSQDQLSTIRFYSPQDPLLDQSRFDIHTDFRVMHWQKPDGTLVSFPMNWENSLRLRPFVRYLHLTYQNMLMGRLDDKLLRVPAAESRRYRERYSIMLDALPLNTYIRAYRGTPMYGEKRSNHSLWIRQRLGLDQFASTDAIEIGGTPNVPFFRVSQMLGDPWVEPSLRQRGRSFHAGLRGVSYGWHLNTSAWSTRSDYTSIKMRAFGAGLNLWGLLLYGERNWRDVEVLQSESGVQATQVYPSSSIGEYTAAFAGPRGVMFGFVQEEMIFAGLPSKRSSIFADLHPIPHLQLEIWRRREYVSRHVEDTLGIIHLYADF